LWGKRRRERKRKKSERQFVARKGSLTSVINSTIGQISRSLEATIPHKHININKMANKIIKECL
jgi:hypothetical protein